MVTTSPRVGQAFGAPPRRRGLYRLQSHRPTVELDGGGPAGSTTRGLLNRGRWSRPLPHRLPAIGPRRSRSHVACRMSHPVSCQLALRRTHLACRSRLRRRRPCRFDNPGLAEPGSVAVPVPAPAPGDRPAPALMPHVAPRTSHRACRTSHVAAPQRPALDGSGDPGCMSGGRELGGSF